MEICIITDLPAFLLSDWPFRDTFLWFGQSGELKNNSSLDQFPEYVNVFFIYVITIHYNIFSHYWETNVLFFKMYNDVVMTVSNTSYGFIPACYTWVQKHHIEVTVYIKKQF